MNNIFKLTGRSAWLATVAVFIAAAMFIIGVEFAFAATTHWVDPAAATAVPGTGCGSDAGYTTIQAAIDVAAPGDVVQVCAGIYVEDLSIPEVTTDLELAGAGVGVSTIKGVATTGAANIYIHTVDGVKIHDFTIESPDVPAGGGTGGITVSGQNIEIYNNKFVSNFADPDSYAIAIQTWRSQWVDAPWFLWKEHDISGMHIHDNTFEDNGATSDNGYYGVWLNRDSGSGLVTVENNTFSGQVRWGIETERSNVLIQGNVFDVTGLRAGISVLDFGDANVNDPEYNGGNPRPQSNVQVVGNTVKGFSNATYAGILIGWPGAPQTFTNVSVTGNTIQNNTNGVMVNSSAGGVLVNNNAITGNTAGAENTDSAELNATCNWWGNANGPSGNGPGSGDTVSVNADFEPWLTTSDLEGPCNGPLPPPSGTMNSSSILIDVLNRGTINNNTSASASTGGNWAGGSRGGRGGDGGEVESNTGDYNNGGAVTGDGGDGGNAGAGGWVTTGNANADASTENVANSTDVEVQLALDMNSSSIELRVDNGTDECDKECSDNNITNNTRARARTGGNSAVGSEGGNADDGGDVEANGSGDFNNGGAVTGDGGDGGNSAEGGTIQTGDASARSSVVNLLNAIMTRIRY